MTRIMDRALRAIAAKRKWLAPLTRDLAVGTSSTNFTGGHGALGRPVCSICLASVPHLVVLRPRKSPAAQPGIRSVAVPVRDVLPGRPGPGAARIRPQRP